VPLDTGPWDFLAEALILPGRQRKLPGFRSAGFENTWDAAKTAEIVFIATPDAAIKESCRIISENNGFRQNSVVYHCSGALASTELDFVRSGHPENTIAIGSMHPLQSFASAKTGKSGNPFANIIMAVEGDSPAVKKAREIAKDLGAKPFTIKTEGKILYHAAAVVASNYLVTLMDLGIKLMIASGVSESEAFEILKPLIQGTLNNIETTGIPDALTGPIARGDVEIVEKHIRAIRARAGEKAGAMADYYILNGIETIRVALAKGSLTLDAAEQLHRVLKS
jgi:predicted short-subunit dehydrogenase-like oxidoreductase (DUF2520 family)